jgi:thioredoxin reductase (NADPH)
MNPYDVFIVGAGPAGLTAAIFAHTKGFRVRVIDGARLGGQLNSLYPTKPVYNYPGYAKIEAGALADKMVSQVRDEGISLIEEEPIKRISMFEKDRLLLESSKTQYRTRSVILACGMGLFTHRTLGIPGEMELERRVLSYSIDELQVWRGRSVAIVGGGNSALDNAVLLHHQDCDVSLIHRLREFQAERATVEKLEQIHAKVWLGWEVVAFQETDRHVSLQLRSTDDRQEKCLTVDRVLVNIGQKTNNDFLNQLSIARDKKRVVVDSEMKTSTPGILACGDVVSYPGKVRLIVTAIGEAATAVNSVEKFLTKNGSEE